MRFVTMCIFNPIMKNEFGQAFIHSLGFKRNCLCNVYLFWMWNENSWSFLFFNKTKIICLLWIKLSQKLYELLSKTNDYYDIEKIIYYKNKWSLLWYWKLGEVIVLLLCTYIISDDSISIRDVRRIILP